MDHHWLKIQFKNNPKKTKAGLAKALNLEPPAISKILADTRQIKAKEYAIMRRFFDLPVDEVQVRTKAHSAKASGKHYSSFYEEGPRSWSSFQDVPAQVIQKRMEPEGQHIRFMQVTEQLMEPHFYKGEYVALDVSDTNPKNSGIFIISDGYSMMLRHCALMPSKTPDTSDSIHVSAFSSDFHTQVIAAHDIQIIGRVIAKVDWV